MACSRHADITHHTAAQHASNWTHCKEVGDVVSKGAIVGMLLEGHDLDGVVAQLADTGQHGHAEVQVAVDPGLLTRHADVAFVNAQRSGPAARQECHLTTLVQSQRGFCLVTP